MKPNTHPETGVAFGVIAADRLNDDIVEQLLYGRHAVNISYETAKSAYINGARFDFECEQKEDQHDADEEFDEDAALERFTDGYQNDEPIIEGTKDGVKYRSSWIGGAMHFYIVESPVTGWYQPCSPCCPGAGDLHTIEGLNSSSETYDVPNNWRWP